MKKLLKVFVAALLAVSLMASMALAVYAEDDFVEIFEEPIVEEEIIEEEPIFEEEIIEEEPVVEEEIIEEEPIFEEEIIEEEPVVEEEIIEEEPVIEEEIIEEEPTEEPVEEPTEEPVVEEPVEEEPIVEEPIVEEEEIPFTGTVEIRMIVDDPEKPLEYGDLITLEAQILLDNEGVAYRIVWEAFKGAVDESGAPIWEVVDDSDTPFYFFELTEETAAWEYRVSLMPLDAE